MSKHSEATFEIASWDEMPWQGSDEAGSITLDLDGVYSSIAEGSRR